MDSNYSNMLGGNKPPTPGGQGQSSVGQGHSSVGQGHSSVYNCGLCGKEFLYYRDLALHERMHLEEITQGVTSHAAVQPRHGYDNRAVPSGLGGVYNTTASAAPPTSNNQLESFEKLVQPFRGDLEMKMQADHRNVVSTIPNTQEPDRVQQQQQLYRNEENRSVALDSRSTPVDSRSVTMDTRNITMDTRPLSVDSRPMSVEGRNLQSLDRSMLPDSRSVPPLGLDSRIPAGYSSTSYLDSQMRDLYSANTANKPHSAAMSSFTPVTPNVRNEDYFVGESRSLPKIDSQLYSKPEPYYSHAKPHYSPHSGASKIQENFTPSPYGIGKILNTQPYYPQPLPVQPQPKYDMDKMPVSSPLGYYNQAGASQMVSKPDIKMPSPKHTLYYGQPPQSQPSSIPANNHFQMGIPKSNHLNDTVRDIQNKIPDPKLDIARSYQAGNESPHPTYGEMFKGSQQQSQVYSSVSSPLATSPVAPSHLDYSAYKLSSEPIPTVNIDSKQAPRLSQPEYVCYICCTPFSDMYSLSEHIKLHAMDTSTPINPPNPPPHPMHLQSQMKEQRPVLNSELNRMPSSPAVERVPPATLSTGGATIVTAAASAPIVKKAENKEERTQKQFMCEVCEENFLTKDLLSEHLKVHMEEVEFECKVCKKVFNKQSKCIRHEALHQKNILLFYCEICAESFKYKGNYLYHVQMQHTESGSLTNSSGTKTNSDPKPEPLLNDRSQLGVKFMSQDNGSNKIVDCQICDEEVEQGDLVTHLKTHAVHKCDKCDRVFTQKTEYVEHLMQVHYRELPDSSDKSGSDSSDIEETNEDVKDRSDMDDGDDESLSSEENTEPEPSRSKAIEEKVAKVDTVVKSEDAKVTEKKMEVNGNNQEKVAISTDIEKETKTKEKIGIKNLKERKKEVMQTLKEKQQEIIDIEQKKKRRELKSLKGKKFISLKKVEVELKFSCSKCNKSFAKKGDLTQHVETHKKDPDLIHCEVCDMQYGLKEKGYYIYHMKVHKDQDLIDSKQVESLPCRVCKAVIPRDTFVTHMKKQHTQFSCDICRWSYSSENSLVTHMKSIHGGKKFKYVKKNSDDEEVVDPKPAPVVYKKLKDVIAMEKEKEVGDKQEKKFVCEVCNMSYAKKYHFDRHLKVHNLKPEEQQIPCELCSNLFPSRGVYLYHILKDHESGGSDELSTKDQQTHDKEVEASKSISETCIAETKVLEGHEKGAQDLNLNTLKPNNLQEEDVGKDGSRISEGNEAEKTDTNKPKAQELIDDLNESKHSVVEKELQISTAKNQTIDSEVDKVSDKELGSGADGTKSTDGVVGEIIYCKLCNKSLKKNSLHEHIKEHNMHSCHACGYSFSKRQAYLHHKQILHIEDIVAEEVQKVESMMQEKNKDGDTGKRKRSDMLKFMSCAICTGEYRPDKYKAHVQCHDTPRLYCQFCGMCVSKKQTLTVHERSHARIVFSENELPYPRFCPICDIAIKSRENYVSHVSEHSKRTPARCKTCGELFVFERTLHNHKKVYHDENIRITWKVDGEGLKFDVKTGRMGEVCSDTLFEIKEINDLLLLKGKPEIWATVTPKKSKAVQKSKEVDYTEDEAYKTEDEDKEKSDTSDDEYMPEPTELRRSGRRRSSRRFSEGDGGDDDGDEDYVPYKKTKLDEMDSDSDEISEEEYTPKGTRTRKITHIKPAADQHSPRENLRRKVMDKSIQKELKTDQSIEETRAKKRQVKEVDRTPSPISSKRARKQSLETSAEESRKFRNISLRERKEIKNDSVEEGKVQSAEKAFPCPVCESSFTRKSNLNAHMNYKHKDHAESPVKSPNSSPTTRSQVVGRLRTRAKNLKADLGAPVSSSTPVKLQNVSVGLSPLNSIAETDKKEKSIDKSRRDKAVDKDKKERVAKVTSSETPDKNAFFVCEICNKKIHHNNKWNYLQHVQSHKKDAKKEKDSKPFSCKDCSESFKKKRDLYIHAKIHSKDQAEEENTTDVSYTSAEMADTTKSSIDTSAERSSDFSVNLRKRAIQSANLADNSENGKTGLNKSKEKCIANSRPKRRSQSGSGNSVEPNQNEVEKHDNVENGSSVNKISPKNGSSPKNKKADSPAAKNGNRRSLNKSNKTKLDEDKSDDHEVQNAAPETKKETNKLIEKPVDSVKQDNSTMVSDQGKGEQKHIMKDQTSIVQSTDKKLPQGIVKLGRRDSENSKSESESLIGNTNGEDSENEVSKHPKTAPAVKKMSSESALSKWKMKVRATLASQLELHATKMQAELDNPEIAKVNKYLSISGKPERLNFECRICGDMFGQEAAFRSHMDVHSEESPPYCSICDIYFMAIYPKRRLLEHNKKKHPDLEKSVVTAAASATTASSSS